MAFKSYSPIHHIHLECDCTDDLHLANETSGTPLIPTSKTASEEIPPEENCILAPDSKRKIFFLGFGRHAK